MSFEHANLVLIGVGALLVIWSILKILGSSLALILWVVLAGLGGSALAYGLELSGASINVSQELKDAVGPSRELSTDALRKLCSTLDLKSSFGSE